MKKSKKRAKKQTRLQRRANPRPVKVQPKKESGVPIKAPEPVPGEPTPVEPSVVPDDAEVEAIA